MVSAELLLLFLFLLKKFSYLEVNDYNYFTLEIYFLEVATLSFTFSFRTQQIIMKISFRLKIQQKGFNLLKSLYSYNPIIPIRKSLLNQ